MEKKNQKIFFIFQITAFEIGVSNLHNLEQDTCHRMSMCSQTPQRFHLTLGETFSKSISLRMMKNMIKVLLSRFRRYFGRFHMFTVKACSETALFREWSNQDFQSLQFRKFISYDNHLFFQNV